MGYPLMVFRGGDVDDYRIVNDEAEEAKAAVEGYGDRHKATAPKAPAPIKRGPGRPPKNREVSA